MKNLLLAVLLSAGPQALAADKGLDLVRGGWLEAAREEARGQKLSPETMTSWRMEGAAVLGEMKLQSGDFSGARETFRDSLNSSAEIDNPHGGVIAFDLYRSAQLLLRQGDERGAAEHLELLIGRYPDSEWSQRAERLLGHIRGEARTPARLDEELATAPSGEQPGAWLGRLQAALKGRREREALDLARRFTQSFPGHSALPEVALAAGVLELKLGEAAAAARGLSELARRASDPALRAKASSLAGAASWEAGDCAGVYRSVPELDASKTADKWLAMAQVWRAACDEKFGRRDQALKRYRAAAASAFDSPVKAYALAAVAAAAERRGKLAEALAPLQQAGELASRWRLQDVAAAARLSRAHLLYRLKRLPAAAAAYSAFAAAHPEDERAPAALFLQGLSLRRARAPGASAAFKLLVERYPDSPKASDAHLQLGQLFAESGRSAQAMEQYRLMGERGGAEAETEALLLQAQVHYNARRYKEAIPLYWLYLQKAPETDRTHEVEELLLTSYWHGDRESPGLAEAAESYPNHPIVAHIRWDLAVSAYKRGEWERAARGFARFEAENGSSPRAADGLFLRAECHRAMGEHRQAAGAFRALLAAHPKHKRAPAAAFALGQSLYEAGDYDASARAFSAVKRGPDAADAAYNRALAHEKAGDKAEALSAYEDFTARFPKSGKAGWAWLQVGLLREGLGKTGPAILAYAKATVGRAQALYAMGRCHEKLKQPAQARRAYEALRKLKPASDSHRLHGLARLGLLYELSSKSRAAALVYSEILRHSPEGPARETARRRLSALSRGGALLSEL